MGRRLEKLGEGGRQIDEGFTPQQTNTGTPVLSTTPAFHRVSRGEELIF